MDAGMKDFTLRAGFRKTGGATYIRAVSREDMALRCRPRVSGVGTVILVFPIDTRVHGDVSF